MEVTEYERQRQERIQANKRKMEEMGLVEASARLRAAGPPALEAGAERAPRLKKRCAQQPSEPETLGPTRLSRRLRGVQALAVEEAAAAGRAEAEAEGRARRVASRKQLTLPEGQQLAAPFSLWSIGVTVWELGVVHRGAWAQRYWSSSGCLYHHAYPVGYRATKVQFGRTYEMCIEEGPMGPVFTVTDQQTGAVFSGASPTKPWTDVCIAHRTGQRISGPLFFGFSDPVTQRAIASNLYSPAELAAALHGQKVDAGPDTSEEATAREFCAVEGIGEATAIILARTTALGGSRHRGLDSLRGWASASDANARALLAYLTGSDEIPEATRRWPAWQERLVPRIVLALSGRSVGPQPGPAAAGEGGSGDEEPEAVAAADSAAAGDASAAQDAAGADGSDRRQNTRPPQEQPPPLRQQQQQQQQQQQAKENQEPEQPSKVGHTQAAASPVAGGQQRSRRERRANPRFVEAFLVGGSSDDDL